MPLAQVFAEFKASVGQCESLIANAHKVEAGGASVLPVIDQKQITVAAFLNMFIAWETFLEASLAELMTGSPTLSGRAPTRFVLAPSRAAARALVVGVMKYFDYGNHDYVAKIARMYFQDGYPYEPHLSAINSELADLRTMRHAAAHVTSTTQTSLESLALRIFARPAIGIELYQLLTANDPRSLTGETVFGAYKEKLVVAAELIVRG